MTDTFRKMLAEAEKRIPFYSGSWVNFLPSDPGMTILEILTLSDGKLMGTQTANYFSDIYPIDCAVLSANA